MTLSINDIIQSKYAAYHSEGSKVFELVSHEIAEGKSVTLSFELIEACSSMFLNASVGKLYLNFSQERIESLLSYSNTGHLHTFTTKLHEVINNALNHDLYDKIVDEAIMA